MTLTKKDEYRCSSALVGFWNFLRVKIFYSSIGCLCHHPHWWQPEHMLNNMTILFLFCLVIFEGNISLNFDLFTLDDNEHASLSAIESDGISCGDQTIM